MLWFHKILKLIFHKQPSHPKIYVQENYLTWQLSRKIFYTFRTTSTIEDMQTVVLNVLFIYFQGKIKFLHNIWSIWLFIILIFV